MVDRIQLGKRSVQVDAVFPLVSGYNFMPQLMAGMVVDRAVGSYDCSVEEMLLHYNLQISEDPEFLEKERARMVLEGVVPEDVEFFLRRPVLIEKLKHQMFAAHVEEAFIARKSQLDKVVFSMIRNKNHELVAELFFRLQSGEDSFAGLAPKYSDGREAKSEGQIGPVELRGLNPKLAHFLSTVKPGALNPPVIIDGYGIITLLKERIPARLDEDMQQNILAYLFDEWVKKEVREYFY
ncbi:MAG: peptidylprolyl isomerase [Chlorobiaceae bacterium]|nr:peptidylprolyl isomerase [Chlorobiaceae bacterium]